MLKYLTKKKHTYWYRRRVSKNKEIVFSLKTKNYDEAVLRHSYINFEINYLFAQGIEQMTDEEIRTIVNKYKNYMLEKQVNKFSRQRDKELSAYINGEFFGGHTKEALQIEIDKYQKVHMSDDYNLVQAITTKILNRSNIKEEFLKLKDEDDIYAFHYELLKAEWDLLYKAKMFQESLPSKSNNIIERVEVKSNSPKQYKISELVQIYLDEKAIANKWSDKNIRDIKYVIKNLISYFNDCFVDDLKRNHFVEFRNSVLQLLPQKTTNKIYKNKTTKEIIELAKKEKKDTLGLTAINKHIGRVNQLFQWAEDTGYIDKNYASNLRLKDERRTKLSKKLRTIYEEEDLIKLFNGSPWFTDDLNNTLKHNPQYIFIPLLALYNGGAKPTELAQLYVNDIKLHKGIWVIEFNNEEDKSLKNDYYNSRRVPIAQKILDLGFLDYVNFQKKQKEKLLFPKVVKYKSGGTSFTNDFTRYNREHITYDKKKTFYSFKHLVNQTLKNNDVKVYIINDITGHSFSSTNKDVGTYGNEQMPEDIMKKTIDKCLTFDYIDLALIKKTIKEIY